MIESWEKWAVAGALLSGLAVSAWLLWWAAQVPLNLEMEG